MSLTFCYRPPGDAWSRLATMVNLLEKLNYTRTTLIQGKDTEDREENKGMSVHSLFFSANNFYIDCFI